MDEIADLNSEIIKINSKISKLYNETHENFSYIKKEYIKKKVNEISDCLEDLKDLVLDLENEINCEDNETNLNLRLDAYKKKKKIWKTFLPYMILFKMSMDFPTDDISNDISIDNDEKKNNYNDLKQKKNNIIVI